MKRPMCRLERRSLLSFFCLLIALSFASAGPVSAQRSRETLDGVRNFGRVTSNYYRGGQVTPEGVERLAGLGVRTIIDLRDEPSLGEPEACERLGITYHKFPMSGHAAPDGADVDKILSIIKDAKAPVYVHCSAGKHRAGTIAALYRMKVEGWAPEQAWSEQQSYGFGLPEEHPELYTFVYGARDMATAPAATRVSARSGLDAGQGGEKDRVAKKDDDDDEDDESDDDGDDEDGDDASESRRVVPAKRSDRDAESVRAVERSAPPAESAASVAALSADGPYLAMDEAIRRARAEGGTGDLLKVDLEYDGVRKVTTWDVTFSSGTEYELNATTGALLASKQKPAGKLAVLTPLALDNEMKTFKEIIAIANGPVTEMELKHIKGRAETVFEVLLADGTLQFYDARSGNAITGL
jgi:tyrosine-protein phosphatase SIW14